ncbi:hypothetical protein [Mesorhizobium sp. CCNWLY176]|uniref:hypothetical protein n=1 Tax=Mesorhizobium sp. CCNWLY176 TaxID=3128543 RepID=UPI003FA5A70E
MAQRIRALEAELGQTLVSRVGRTVRSTAAGMASSDTDQIWSRQPAIFGRSRRVTCRLDRCGLVRPRRRSRAKFPKS